MRKETVHCVTVTMSLTELLERLGYQTDATVVIVGHEVQIFYSLTDSEGEEE